MLRGGLGRTESEDGRWGRMVFIGAPEVHPGKHPKRSGRSTPEGTLEVTQKVGGKFGRKIIETNIRGHYIHEILVCHVFDASIPSETHDRKYRDDHRCFVRKRNVHSIFEQRMGMLRRLSSRTMESVQSLPMVVGMALGKHDQSFKIRIQRTGMDSASTPGTYRVETIYHSGPFKRGRTKVPPKGRSK